MHLLVLVLPHPCNHYLIVVGRTRVLLRGQKLFVELFTRTQTTVNNVDVLTQLESRKPNHFFSQINNTHRLSHVKNKNLPSMPHKGSLQHQLTSLGNGHKEPGNFGMGHRNRSSLRNLAFEQEHHRTVGSQNVAKTSSHKSGRKSGQLCHRLNVDFT